MNTVICNRNKTHRALVREYGRIVAGEMLAGGFAATLANAVNQSEYNRQQIADIVGCSKVAVDKWIYGENYPAVHYLYRLAVLLYPGDAAAALVDLAHKINRERELQ